MATWYKQKKSTKFWNMFFFKMDILTNYFVLTQVKMGEIRIKQWACFQF